MPWNFIFRPLSSALLKLGRKLIKLVLGWWSPISSLAGIIIHIICTKTDSFTYKIFKVSQLTIKPISQKLNPIHSSLPDEVTTKHQVQVMALKTVSRGQSSPNLHSLCVTTTASCQPQTFWISLFCVLKHMVQGRSRKLNAAISVSKYFRLAGTMVPVKTTQICHYSTREVIDAT